MIAASRRSIFGGVMVRVVGMELPAQRDLRPELIHIIRLEQMFLTPSSTSFAPVASLGEQVGDQPDQPPALRQLDQRRELGITSRAVGATR
jgi:hypothetical protein